jgi:Uma2 family endonuclease
MSERPPNKGGTVLPERYSAPTPLVPDAETWRGMTPEQRTAKIFDILDAMPIEEFMSEGTEHSDAKRAAVGVLRRFFAHGRRAGFVAPELAVLYPGERSFVPDLVVVLDVEVRHRLAWVVMDEGRGPDFVLEIRNKGRRAKDYTRNVPWFARLGIPEYFIYEIQRREIAGFRLADPEATTYTPIIPQAGRYASQILELDLAVVDGRLRFYTSGAELPDARTEVELLGRMVADRAAAIEAAEARATAAVGALREAIATLLTARGLPVSPTLSARLAEVDDVGELTAALRRAATVATADDVLGP